jgi:small-conductance mechanosensitive channel
MSGKPSEAVARGILAKLTWTTGLEAAAAIVGFLLVANLSGRLVRWAFSRRSTRVGAVFALSKLLSYSLVFLGVIVALAVLGIPLSSLLVTFSALLVGVGFSLQTVMQNFIAGIVLLVEQPIRKGDFIGFGQTLGSVLEIGLRATTLSTLDGTVLVVPNHLLVTTEVSNHSHPMERSRLNIKLRVSYREDIDVVKETLLNVAQHHPEVLPDPQPLVFLDQFGESDYVLNLVAWVKTPLTQRRTASELRFAIARAFARRQIPFPMPELQLHT